jgi:hypothetical protein
MTKENTESDDMICCSQDSEGGDMMKHCPMAERFDEIIGKSQLGFYLIIFGIALVVLGIAIVVKPSILVWPCVIETMVNCDAKSWRQAI